MTADRCFGLAVVDLGVQPSEFWRMSPRQFAEAFDVVLDRRKELENREERADLRAALLICKVNNLFGSRPITVEDVFPWLVAEPPSPETVLRKFQAFSAAHNARVAEA